MRYDRAPASAWRAMQLICACPMVVGCQQAPRPDFLQKPSPEHVRLMCYNVNWDAIFPDDDPENHKWRRVGKRDEFVRVVRAIDPDIVCLQEINPDRDAQQVADILDDVAPLSGNQKWRAYRGRDNVIAAKFDLAMVAADCDPKTNRGHAMAMVDLPDQRFGRDVYIVNVHFKSAGGDKNIKRRQHHADAIICWIRDIKTPGGHIDLPADTPVIVLGDLNVYETDPAYHLETLLKGDVVNEERFGRDTAPDWDETPMTDLLPRHNAKGEETWTWRDDTGEFNRGPLDRIIYTDSVLRVDHAFVLDTATMTPADLESAGLQAGDVALDLEKGKFDHLPMVADFVLIDRSTQDK